MAAAGGHWVKGRFRKASNFQQHPDLTPDGGARAGGGRRRVMSMDELARSVNADSYTRRAQTSRQGSLFNLF